MVYSVYEVLILVGGYYVGLTLLFRKMYTMVIRFEDARKKLLWSIS